MKRKYPWILIPSIIVELLITIMLIVESNYVGAIGWGLLMFANLDIFYHTQNKNDEPGTDNTSL